MDEVLSFFAGKKVLVTGGTGLVGREVCDLLVEAGAEVKAVSLDRLNPSPDVNYVLGDLTDLSVCLRETENMDCVCHLAGIKGSLEVTQSKPASFMVPMLMFNTNVLEAARRNLVPKLVYTSSIGAYQSAELFVETAPQDRPPMDFFPGWAKRIAELQIQAYRIQDGLDWAVVRPCNVYGPGDNFDPDNAMVIPSIMMKILRGDDPVKVWGDGSAVRDFAFSRDIAKGVVQALFFGTRGDFVNLGSGQEISIKEMIETLSQFIEFRYEFDENKPSGFSRRVMDISRARDWIGYDPSTSLREGLELTWRWLIAHQSEHLLKQNYFACENESATGGIK